MQLLAHKEVEHIKTLGDVEKVTTTGNTVKVYPRFRNAENKYLLNQFREMDDWELTGVHIHDGYYLLEQA